MREARAAEQPQLMSAEEVNAKMQILMKNPELWTRFKNELSEHSANHRNVRIFMQDFLREHNHELQEGQGLPPPPPPPGRGKAQRRGSLMDAISGFSADSARRLEEESAASAPYNLQPAAVVTASAASRRFPPDTTLQTNRSEVQSRLTPGRTHSGPVAQHVPPNHRIDPRRRSFSARNVTDSVSPFGSEDYSDSKSRSLHTRSVWMNLELEVEALPSKIPECPPPQPAGSYQAPTPLSPKPSSPTSKPSVGFNWSPQATRKFVDVLSSLSEEADVPASRRAPHLPPPPNPVSSIPPPTAPTPNEGLQDIDLNSNHEQKEHLSVLVAATPTNSGRTNEENPDSGGGLVERTIRRVSTIFTQDMTSELEAALDQASSHSRRSNRSSATSDTPQKQYESSALSPAAWMNESYASMSSIGSNPNRAFQPIPESDDEGDDGNGYKVHLASEHATQQHAAGKADITVSKQPEQQEEHLLLDLQNDANIALVDDHKLSQPGDTDVENGDVDHPVDEDDDLI